MRRVAPVIALGLALIVVAGCQTVGPDYHLPPNASIRAPSAQGGFVGAKANTAVSDAQPPDGWWRLYDDPRLDGLVKKAFAANTDLRIAEANLERSQALVSEAKAAGRPNLTVNFDPSYAQLSPEQYLVTQPVPVQGLYDVGLALSYEVDLFGRIRRGVEAAQADDEAVEASRDLVRVNVAAEVTRAYVDACGAGAELTSARQSLELQRRSLEFTQRLLGAGRGSALDVVRSRGQAEQLRGNIPVLLARQRNAEFRLATLTGQPPAEFDASLDACAAPPILRRPIPVGDGAALLKRRPDVREAERRLAAATATIGIRTAALYPTITLGASVGSTGATASAFSALTNRYAVGPGIVWSLDHTADRARIEQARAQAKAELAHFDGVVLIALREVESALNGYSRDLERDASIKAARDQALQALADVHRLQSVGRATALATLDAERTLAMEEVAVTASENQLSTDQVGLFLALGGGWRGDSPALGPPAAHAVVGAARQETARELPAAVGQVWR